jgi:uncharacterized membrane protein
MALHQIENPPEHQETAPQGEIRQEPMSTLRRFSLFIAAAFSLPALGMVIAGFELGRKWLAVTGLILLVGWGIVYFVILYQIMKSRKVDPSERSPHERFP